MTGPFKYRVYSMALATARARQNNKSAWTEREDELRDSKPIMQGRTPETVGSVSRSSTCHSDGQPSSVDRPHNRDGDIRSKIDARTTDVRLGFAVHFTQIPAPEKLLATKAFASSRAGTPIQCRRAEGFMITTSSGPCTRNSRMCARESAILTPRRSPVRVRTADIPPSTGTVSRIEGPGRSSSANRTTRSGAEAGTSRISARILRTFRAENHASIVRRNARA